MLDHFYPFIGGVETLFDEVSRFCAEHNTKVTILTSRHRPDLKKIEKRGEVTIYRVGHGRYSVAFAQLWFCLRQRELLQSVDHIHTSTFASCLAAWLVAKWYEKSVTLTIHELYHDWWYYLKQYTARFFVWYEALICRLPWAKITTVSEASKRDILHHHPHLCQDDIQVIVNQIDVVFWDPRQVKQSEQNYLRNQYGIIQSDNLLLYAGRLGYEKGLPYLLEAFSQFALENKDRKLVIIAPRTHESYGVAVQKQIALIEQIIKDNYLHERVIWIDPVASREDLRLWMSIVQVGVVPSMNEGFCYLAHEMQAMGLSVIASRVGALPELLDPNMTVFVSYGKVQDLLGALRSLPLLRREKSIEKVAPAYHEYLMLFQACNDQYIQTKKNPSV